MTEDGCPLSQRSRELLEEIFRASGRATDGCQAPRFRADHADDIPLLDTLEQDRYLCRKSDTYVVSVAALSHLEDLRAKRLLVLAERIFEVLKDAYAKNLQQSVRVTEIANALQHEEEEVRLCLRYMIEASGWWSSHSSDLLWDSNASVAPAEQILALDSFETLVTRLQDSMERGRKEREQNRSNLQIKPSVGIDDGDVCNSTSGGAGHVEPRWFSSVPDKMQFIMREIYRALGTGMSALPAMGVRAVIDMVCVDQIGDVGSFENKIDRLVDEGHISANDKESLKSAIELGSASAHRGHLPDEDSVMRAVEICEHFLQKTYALPESSERLRRTTPPRPPRK